MNHIHVVNHVMEKFGEYNQPFYMPVTDNEKSFDSEEVPAKMGSVQITGSARHVPTALLEFI